MPDTVSHRQLVWRRFRRHRLGMAGLIVTALIYLVALFVEILAPHGPREYTARLAFHPPQKIHWRLDAAWAPHVLGHKATVDYNTGLRTFEEDPAQVIRLGLWVRGDAYKLWGVIPGDRHLIGPVNPRDRVFIAGADRLGRDVFSRTVHATRVSMTIGLVGVALSLVLGLLIGGISGYFGGWIDVGIQRLIEFLQSIPSIPLWIGLAAAIPATAPAASDLLPNHGDPVDPWLDGSGTCGARPGSWP